jgi:hypothetical protein
MAPPIPFAGESSEDVFPECLILGFGGAIFSPKWRGHLWGKFFTAAHNYSGSPSSNTAKSREPERVRIDPVPKFVADSRVAG